MKTQEKQVQASCKRFVKQINMHVAGWLEEQEAAALDRHLTDCPHCRCRVLEIERIAGLVGMGEAPSAPHINVQAMPSREMSVSSLSPRRMLLGFAALPPKPIDTSEPERMHAWVDKSSRALELLRKASLMKECDWGLDYSAGLDLELPHLGKMRNLADAALARAEATAQKNPAQAHADLQAAMRAAQHVGSDHLIICQLVRIAIEKKVTGMLFSNADAQAGASIQSWRELLDNLPRPPTFAERVECERRISVGQMQLRIKDAGEKELADANRLLDMHLRSVAELRNLVERTDADYRQLVRIAALPPEERKVAFDKFEKKLGESGPEHQLSKMLIPALGKMSGRLQEAEANMSKLRQRVMEEK